MTETDVENPQTRHLQRPEGRIAYHMARHEPLVVRSRVERPVRPRLGIGNVRAVSRTVDRVAPNAAASRSSRCARITPEYAVFVAGASSVIGVRLHGVGDVVLDEVGVDGDRCGGAWPAEVITWARGWTTLPAAHTQGCWCGPCRRR